MKWLWWTGFADEISDHLSQELISKLEKKIKAMLEEARGRRVSHKLFTWWTELSFIRIQYTLWVRKKLDSFSFEHNFGKYCPILIILSLLQTEINCNQVYPKIYHQTPNLLVDYLVKWTTLLARFRNWRCNSQTSHTECNRYGQKILPLWPICWLEVECM